MLGFLYSKEGDACFEPTSSFRLPHAGCPTGWYAADVRHGRILVSADVSSIPPRKDFIVLNPMTGDAQRLRMPQFEYNDFWAATLLCATLGCDHLDCPSGGPFSVVFLGTDESDEFTSACIYSSEADTWSETTSVEHPKNCFLRGSSALGRSALYFACFDSTQILEYSLGNGELSFIGLPPGCNGNDGVPMIAEEGGLEFAVHESKLYIWLREDGPEGCAGWTQQRVIDLVNLFPDCVLSIPFILVASADGIGVIFVRRGNMLFTVDLKSLQVTKVWEGTHIHNIIPYMSFCTPALTVPSTSKEPKSGCLKCSINLRNTKKLLMKYGVRSLSAA
ncbi:hypothetical protein ACP70R_014628 [Stipagrostis hirtigluma subsp. patula]